MFSSLRYFVKLNKKILHLDILKKPKRKKVIHFFSFSFKKTLTTKIRKTKTKNFKSSLFPNETRFFTEGRGWHIQTNRQTSELTYSNVQEAGLVKIGIPQKVKITYTQSVFYGTKCYQV